MKFLYNARDSQGSIKTGTVVAVDAARAEHLLKENGLVIVSLQQQDEDIFEKFNPFGKTVSNKDLVLFSRQLATLISARVPILQSLRILEEQIENAYLLKILRDVVSTVENGDSLSIALAKYDKVFGGVYISLVRAGEASGSLDKSLVYLADQLEKDYELRSKVKSAMTYPIFILSALVIVGGLMFKFILPNLTQTLLEEGGSLPLVTVILINFTTFFNQYWWMLLILLLVLIFGIRYFINTTYGRYKWDALKIHIPIIGDIFRKIYVVRFSRNLSTLVMGGIPIIKAMEIVADIINNVVYRDIVLQTADKIAGGKSISDGLSGHPEFPNIVTQMVKVGEQTAQLDDILAKLASFYEKEVDAKISTLSTLMEPVIMVLLGIGVGVMVAGILLPIYNFSSATGG